MTKNHQRYQVSLYITLYNVLSIKIVRLISNQEFSLKLSCKLINLLLQLIKHYINYITINLDFWDTTWHTVHTCGSDCFHFVLIYNYAANYHYTNWLVGLWLTNIIMVVQIYVRNFYNTRSKNMYYCFCLVLVITKMLGQGCY